MPYSNGWLVNDAGKAAVSAGPVTNPVYQGGAAYAADGTRYVSLYGGSVGATDVYLNGFLHSATGQLKYVASLPSPAYVKDGITINSVGAAYLDSAGARASFLRGIGLTASGALTVTGI
jgi:hypothetical protein